MNHIKLASLALLMTGCSVSNESLESNLQTKSRINTPYCLQLDSGNLKNIGEITLDSIPSHLCIDEKRRQLSAVVVDESSCKLLNKFNFDLEITENGTMLQRNFLINRGTDSEAGHLKQNSVRFVLSMSSLTSTGYLVSYETASSELFITKIMVSNSTMSINEDLCGIKSNSI